MRLAIALSCLWFPLAAAAALAQADPASPPRLRPAFFEESRRQGRSGFQDTFLGDALDGRADLLGTSSLTGAARSPSQPSTLVPRSAESLNRPAQPPIAPVTPPVVVPPGPGFDRTSVIIRR